MNSVLNPEAPEFYPHLTSTTKDAYTTVQKSIKASSQLPTGISFDMFKTFTEFNKTTRQLGENIVIQSNNILARESAVRLKCFDNNENTDKIIDINDDVLDRLSAAVETAAGGGPQTVKIAAWNNNPVIAKIQVGSTTFIGAKNIQRPQLTFKDVVDNTMSLWVPKISDKPNSIKPLALSILYNDNGEAVGYEHPYHVELELYEPPAKFLEVAETPTPPPLEETTLTLVETAAQLDQLLEHLERVDEIAVDLEHHSYRTYQGFTCLIQISTDTGGDFIIDALAVREHLHKLNQAFTDPKKLKVFHGAENDVLWLQRDFGVYVVGMFDTHQAACALRHSGHALKNLLLTYCGVNADKKFQLADWRIRPLPSELVQYARIDTHYLLYIARRMRSELRGVDADGARLRYVFRQSRDVCASTYNKDVVHENSHLPLYVRSKKCFNSRQMAALRMLYRWRDQHARELDESTTYLLPNHMLLALAESLPREVQGVHAVCSPMPPFLKQHVVAMHRMLLSCRELPLEPQLLRAGGELSAQAAPAPAHYAHDLHHMPDFSPELSIELELGWELASSPPGFVADITVFQPAGADSAPFVSDLNAEAKMFIPPYDRYRKYRSLAQIEEIKEYKEKEAKIVALGQGDELIKREVLLKLQQAKSLIESEGHAKAKPDEQEAKPKEATPEDTSTRDKRRKRKMSAEKGRKEEVTAPPPAVEKPARTTIYNNVNYNKFQEHNEKPRRHPKTKLKNKH